MPAAGAIGVLTQYNTPTAPPHALSLSIQGRRRPHTHPSLPSSPSLNSLTPYASFVFFLTLAQYGEDRRHAAKKETAFHGFRLTLAKPIDQAAVRARIMEILKQEGAHSTLRIRMLSMTNYTYTTAPDAEVADSLIRVGASGIEEQATQLAAATEMWGSGHPWRIWFDGNRLDLMSHHAVSDGVRAVRLLNDVLGNLRRKGAINPQKLPCCALACSVSALARIMAFERPKGTLSSSFVPRTPAFGEVTFHESHYVKIPTALIKRCKETHGLGFAPALQGLILWALHRCKNTPEKLHCATTVGFKTDYWAFPIATKTTPSPQELGKVVAKLQRRNGMVCGFGCLLANASAGGMFDSMAEMYRSIDVLIGGGPLILDPSCGYETYSLFKFHHTVPVYIFYATLCDTIDVSIQSRVPLPDLEHAFNEALAFLKE
jgi:hypothetical protein